MATVSYRKYAGKKQANIKPMVILMFAVGVILVISLIVVIVLKIIGGQEPARDDQSEMSTSGTMIGANDDKEEDKKVIRKIIIKIAEQDFIATLEDTEAAQAFAALLPLEKNMVDLNKNEKYYDLHKNLPSNPERVGRIEAGDLMLFQNNFIVVFYKTHSTEYSYTRLGKIDNPTGLAQAVGSGDVVIKFDVLDEDAR